MYRVQTICPLGILHPTSAAEGLSLLPAGVAGTHSRCQGNKVEYPGLDSLPFRKEGARQIHKSPDKGMAPSGRGGPVGTPPLSKIKCNHAFPLSCFSTL